MRWILARRSTGPTSELGQLVQSLGLGQTALLGDTGMSSAADQFNWQSRFFYDATRKYAVACGKIQSPSTVTWVGQYSEDTNSWASGNFQFPLTTRGHVYEGYTYDPTTGRTYFIENGGAVDRIAVHAHGDAFNVWSYIGQDPETKGLPTPGTSTSLLASTGNFVTNSNCAAHHPSFYGSGLAGILIGCHFGFAGYRIGTDTYSTVISRATWSSLLGAATMSLTAALYVTGLNAVIFTAGDDGNILWKMDAGGTVTRLVDTAIRCGPDAGSGNGLKLVDDPEGGPTFYGMEAGGTKRVFKFNNSTSTLEDTGTVHPYSAIDGNDENYIFAACKPTGCTHGAIWGIEESTSSWRSRMYRPAV